MDAQAVNTCDTKSLKRRRAQAACADLGSLVNRMSILAVQKSNSACPCLRKSPCFFKYRVAESARANAASATTSQVGATKPNLPNGESRLSLHIARRCEAACGLKSLKPCPSRVPVRQEKCENLQQNEVLMPADMRSTLVQVKSTTKPPR